jgi:hypothetical protein
VLGTVAVALVVLASCSSVPPTPTPTPTDTTTSVPTQVASASPSASSPFAALSVGACAGPLPDSSEPDGTVTAKDCSDEHSWEVSAVVPLTSTAYPGEDELTALGDSACARAFSDYVGVEVAASPYSATYVAPREGYWPIPEARELVCLVGTEAGGLKKSLKDHPVVFPESRQCLGEPADGSAGYPLVACSSEHLYEVYASLKFAGSQRPSEADIDKAYSSACVDGFTDFVGVKLAKSKYEIQHFLLPEDLWKKYSDHRLVCAVGSPSGGITGSLKDAKK